MTDACKETKDINEKSEKSIHQEKQPVQIDIDL